MNTKGKILIIILILSIISACILCGFGCFKQLTMNKTNEKRKIYAEEQTQIAINTANKRLQEIETEIEQLDEEYSSKQSSLQLMNMMNYTWSPEYTQFQGELTNISIKINDLNKEIIEIQNKDYTVNYETVQPSSYLVYYYIGGGLIVIAIIAYVILKKTSKKSNDSEKNN